MGLVQYARVLAEIKTEPKTHEQVSAASGRGKQTMREILWRLEHLRIVHVVEWRRPEKLRSLMAAAFVLGEGESAPYPNALKRATPGSELARNNPRPELIAFATIINALRNGATRAELHRQTGVAHHNIARLLRELRANGLLHIGAWEVRDSTAGKPSEVLQFGPGKDAPRPKTLTAKQKQDRYRMRRRQRTATLRIVGAIAGQAAIPKHGMQSYHLLGGVAA